MIIRVSFLVVASVAALTAKQIVTNPPTKKNSNIRSPGSHDFNEREGSSITDTYTPQAREGEETEINTMPRNQHKGDSHNVQLLTSGDKQGNVTEMELLRNLARTYKQRQAILERKLIDLKDLKEEQSAIGQLRRQLAEKTAKLDLLNAEIASLQTESKKVQDKIRKGVLEEMQLDIAKRTIKEMQMKSKINASRIKEQISMLQQQLTGFRPNDDSVRNAMALNKFRSAKDVELRVLELRRKNMELELEKREVGAKLITSRATVITQDKKLANIREEITCLRNDNEELSEQVERLQENRFGMVQELVYQRWLYTCLRYEVHNHQRQPRNGGQNSNKKLYIKTNVLSHEPALDSVSSSATLRESDEDDSTTLESSSSSQSSSIRNSTLLFGLKRWRKRTPSSNRRLIRRFSTSMDPADSDDEMVQNSSKFLETTISSGLKRVSFDASETNEGVITYDKETKSGQSREERSRITSGNKFEKDQYDKPSNANEHAGNNPSKYDTMTQNKGNEIGLSEESTSHRKNVITKNDWIKLKNQVGQLVALFFLFLVLLILQAYFQIK